RVSRVNGWSPSWRPQPARITARKAAKAPLPRRASGGSGRVSCWENNVIKISVLLASGEDRRRSEVGDGRPPRVNWPSRAPCPYNGKPVHCTQTPMITIYHNPRCSKSRQTLALLEARGLEPEVILYLDTPPDAATLKSLLNKLGIGPRDRP